MAEAIEEAVAEVVAVAVSEAVSWYSRKAVGEAVAEATAATATRAEATPATSSTHEQHDGQAAARTSHEALRGEQAAHEPREHEVEQITNALLKEGSELLQRLQSAEAREVAELVASDCASPVARVLQGEIARTSPRRELDGGQSLEARVADLMQEGAALLTRLEPEEAQKFAALVAEAAERAGSPVARALVAEVAKRDTVEDVSQGVAV